MVARLMYVHVTQINKNGIQEESKYKRPTLYMPEFIEIYFDILHCFVKLFVLAEPWLITYIRVVGNKGKGVDKA